MPADSVTMESDMKPDQERVKNLLTDTVTLLCKNGLTFSEQLRIEGLLGVSIDNSDVFFVHISEKFSTGVERKEKDPQPQTYAEEQSEEPASPPPTTPEESMDQKIPIQQFTAPSPKQRVPRESPCPSPLAQQAQPASPIPSIEAGNVKLEPVEELDDLLIMEEPNQELLEKVARKASMVAGRRRVHSSQSRSHSSSAHSQHGDYSDWDSESGEPASKRHHSMSDGGENGAYMAMHGQDLGGWPDLSGIGEQSGQAYSGAGGGGYDMSSPGCSTWTAAASQSQEMMSVSAHNQPSLRFPATPIQSSAIRKLLTRVVQPTHDRGDKVCAFRMVWSTKQLPEDTIWQQLTQHARDVLDEQIKKINGISFFISAITATVSNLHQRRDVSPATGYFVVGDRATFVEPTMYLSIRNNPFGGVLKFLTERGVKAGCDRNLHWLTILLKDNIAGYVHGKVTRWGHERGMPLAKIYVHNVEYLQVLSQAKAELDAAGFPVELEQY